MDMRPSATFCTSLPRPITAKSPTFQLFLTHSFGFSGLWNEVLKTTDFFPLLDREMERRGTEETTNGRENNRMETADRGEAQVRCRQPQVLLWHRCQTLVPSPGRAAYRSPEAAVSSSWRSRTSWLHIKSLTVSSGEDFLVKIKGGPRLWSSPLAHFVLRLWLCVNTSTRPSVCCVALTLFIMGSAANCVHVHG